MAFAESVEEAVMASEATKGSRWIDWVRRLKRRRMAENLKVRAMIIPAWQFAVQLSMKRKAEYMCDDHDLSTSVSCISNTSDDAVQDQGSAHGSCNWSHHNGFKVVTLPSCFLIFTM